MHMRVLTPRACICLRQHFTDSRRQEPQGRLQSAEFGSGPHTRFENRRYEACARELAGVVMSVFGVTDTVSGWADGSVHMLRVF